MLALDNTTDYIDAKQKGRIWLRIPISIAMSQCMTRKTSLPPTTIDGTMQTMYGRRRYSIQ